MIASKISDVGFIILFSMGFTSHLLIMTFLIIFLKIY